MSTKSNLATQLDLNKTNIVLGKGYAIEKLVEEIKTEQQNNIIDNDFDFLPSPVVHHENYDTSFKGFLWSYHNPIIFVQNKEFLEACLNSVDSGFNLVSTDFNVVQVDLEPIRNGKGELTFITTSTGGKEVNAKLVFKTYSKEEAKKLMLEQKIDLRNVNFGGYGKL